MSADTPDQPESHPEQAPVKRRNRDVKDTLERALVFQKLIEYRRKGYNKRQCAHLLEMTPSDVGRLWKRVDEELINVSDEVPVVKALELQRLDELQVKVYEQALEGTPRAVELYLKIAERRSKMLGLDAPTKQQVEVASQNVVVEASWGDVQEEPKDATATHVDGEATASLPATGDDRG